MIQKFLGLLDNYENSLLSDLRKNLIGKKVPISKDMANNDVMRRYAEYQADLIEIRTIKNFFNTIEDNNKALFTDYIKLSAILEVLPLSARERATIVIEAFKKNIRSGILEVEDFETSFIIDANKLVVCKFKTLTSEQVFNMYKNGTIIDFIYQDEDQVTPEVKAQIDELIARRDEYCMDTMKIYDDTLRLRELLIEKDGLQTDDEIALVGKIMKSERVSDSIVDDVIAFLTNKRNKNLARIEKEEKDKEVLAKPVKVVEIKQSNLVTDKEYKAIKKEIKQYYDLYHMEILQDIDYETMIRLTSLMIRIGVHKDEIKRFISKVKDTLIVSDNSITTFVHEYDRLNYYYEEEDLKDILEYLEEIFICSDEDYEFWKDEIRKELNRLLSNIDSKYDYEIDVAKKRLSI